MQLNKTKFRVFVSSAMSDENGISWMEIRNSIKSRLMGCPYLETFTIEDHVTEIPSTQFFLMKIEQTDAVVILIKDDIRPGTTQEIVRAQELGKPMLVYFCKSSEAKNSIKEFKNQLISKDQLTFKEVENFDGIDEVVLNDVINNVIHYYKFKHGSPVQETEEKFMSNNELIDISILDKNFLKYFGNNRNTLIDLLGLTNYSQKSDEKNEQNLGNKLIEWLCTGKTFVDNQDTSKLFEELSLPENIERVLKARSESIQKYFNGDLEKSLLELDKAYDLGVKEKLPTWLLGEILIDSRNIHGQLDFFEKKYQKKINELDSFIHFPIGDRFLKIAFETLEKERMKIRNSKNSSANLGNTLMSSLGDIEKYLYTGFVVGSSTHLLIARKN